MQRIVRWSAGSPSVYCGEVSRDSCVSRCGIDISLQRRRRRRRKVEGDKYLYRIVGLKGDYFCLFAFFFFFFYFFKIDLNMLLFWWEGPKRIDKGIICGVRL